MSPHARTALLALALAAALSACGSSTTTTVTAKGEPPPASSTPSTTKSAPSSTTATSTQTSSADEGARTTPAKTHTAPEPAFAEGEAKGSGASAAAALLRARGYTPVEPAQYHEAQTLGVLVGRRAASGGGSAEQAFFFLDGRYLGTDAKEPSASVQVLSQNDTEVTLAYALYRPGDPLGSPSGGRALVDFQLNDGKLQAIGQIPPVDSASAASRR